MKKDVRPITLPNRIAIDPPVITWQFDQPSERDRANGKTDIKLILTGRNAADIKASFENACENLGWNKK
jgi:hypothetical protein